MESFGNYVDLEFLGQGGMGKVYKAYDPVLQRTVALKFIQGDSPALKERLLLEARSQARIEHENVCRVYEAGEINGLPYIAMQFVRGKALTELTTEMKLDEKIKVMKEVAEAVHAAHRAGLIHRDLKPGNVMVERSDEGVWIPHVMDFGLVREIEAPGLTVSGVVVGSPWYMAPEQALGAAHKLDRRADVYSLGATLYEWLSGRLPFEANSTVEVLFKLIHEEPTPLNKRNRSIPGDVVTIVMKCLEKDPGNRYDSAKALAEDLGRYLEGEPILARPLGMVPRVFRKIRRNKVTSAIVGLALLFVLVSAAIGIQAQISARRQLTLARQFGQDIKEMESILRFAYLLPLHDVGPEMQKVRERMDAIAAQIRGPGSPAYGPGHYALGRGWLALHDVDKAEAELNHTWNAGYREPEVSFALGQVKAEQYRKALAEAERIGNKELRESRKREIERDYRDPAMNYLRQGRSSRMESPTYSEALMAFLSHQYPAALEKAQAAEKDRSWVYEASKLRGDVYAAMGNDRRDAGNNEEAAKLYRTAETFYKSSIEKGSSDPEGYLGLCSLNLDLIQMQLYQSGSSPEAAFGSAVRSCDQALVANPRSVEAMIRKSYAYWRHGEYQSLQGQDPGPAFTESIRNARQALALDSKQETAWNNLGNVYTMQGEYDMSRGADPAPVLREAITSYNKAIEINPNRDILYNNMAITYVDLAESEMGRGKDPRSTLKKAIDSFNKSIRISPGFVGPYLNMGIAYMDLERYEGSHGLDSRDSLQKTIDCYQKAIEINPKLPFAYNNLGDALLDHANNEIAHGSDPQPFFQDAIRNFDKAIALNPNYASPLNNKGNALEFMARHVMSLNKDPQQMLNDSIDSYRNAIKINPNYGHAFRSMGGSFLYLAEYETRQGRAPDKFLAQGREALARATKLNPNDSLIFLLQAKSEWIEAKWKYKMRKPTETQIVSGLLMIEKALSMNSNESEALAVRGCLQLLRAQSAPAMRRQNAEKAVADLTKAMSLDPTLLRDYESYLSSAKSLL